MASEHKTDFKYKKDKSSDVYDTLDKHSLSGLSGKNIGTVWWKKKNMGKKLDPKTRGLLKGNPDISSLIPPGGEKVSDIPDEMGSFETKTVGTIMVGFDRYNKNSDLGFSVVSDKDKNRHGIEERDEDNPNTYFGGNFDGEEKTFKAGNISFRYNRKTKEIDKIERAKNESPLNDEENLLYRDEKEKKELERLNQEEMSRPNEVMRLDKEKEKTEKIRDSKRKENDDFLKEIMEFIKKLKDGKLNMLVESDEAANRRKRIIELSQTQSSIPIEEMKRMLKEIFDEEKVEEILAGLLVRAKITGLDSEELIQIVKDLKKEVLR